MYRVYFRMNGSLSQKNAKWKVILIYIDEMFDIIYYRQKNEDVTYV